MLDPKYDLVFKQIFELDRNKSFLKKLLKEAFNIPNEIEQLEFYKQEMTDGRKKVIVDIMLLEKERKYLVEMQMAHEPQFIDRCIYYLAKSLSLDLQKDVISEHKKRKTKLRPSKILAICNFNLFKNKEPFKSNHKIMDVVDGSITTEALEMCFIELRKAPKINDLSKASIVEKLMYFLTRYKEPRFVEVCENDPDLCSLVNSFLYVQMSDSEKELYEMSRWYQDE